MAEKMSHCQVCGQITPASDYNAQKEHMERKHPEVIIKRLREASCHKEADGYIEWCDAEGVSIPAEAR